jgi:hypothetical protein
VDQNYTVPAANTHPITLVRDYVFARVMTVEVKVDGKLVAYIEREQKITLYLPEGPHLLTAGTADLKAIGPSDFSVAVQIPSAFPVYRISVEGDVKIQPSRS